MITGATHGSGRSFERSANCTSRRLEGVPEGSRALNRQPSWLALLPAPFAVPTEPADPPLLETVCARLAAAGMELDPAWIHDVREWFDTPRDLYDCLSFWWQSGGAPAWEEAGAVFERIFHEHAVQGSIWLPHGRTLWRARVP